MWLRPMPGVLQNFAFAVGPDGRSVVSGFRPNVTVEGEKLHGQVFDQLDPDVARASASSRSGTGSTP